MNAAVAEEIIAQPEIDRMHEVLERQRHAFQQELPVTADTRIDRINRCINLLLKHQDDLADAMNKDFGCRPQLMSKFVDVASSVGQLKHARSNLKRWMKDERQPVRFPLGMLGAKARISYQPKGVVGIIAPWNFPVNMAFGPLTCALAAGNRCMVKPSELTPETSSLMAELISQNFDDSEVCFFTGGPEIGKAFSQLPFDHLLFTGSTSIGRHILRAAAENLVPVTLELGGKSPTIIGKSADIAATAEKIAMGKLMNAGQVCLAPDYVFVQRDQRAELVEAIKNSAAAMQAKVSDVSSIVSERHAGRIHQLIDEAQASGTTVVHTVDAGQMDHPRQIPLTLVVNPDQSLKLMQEEIFGPILPILEYDQIDEVIEYINSHSRPLGLYYFGSDQAEQQQVLQQTISGGVTLQDVIFHVSVHELPFGGVGASGMGSYHGHHGFKTFSHAKAVFQQARISIGKLIGMIPPYGKKLEQALKMDMKP